MLSLAGCVVVSFLECCTLSSVAHRLRRMLSVALLGFRLFCDVPVSHLIRCMFCSLRASSVVQVVGCVSCELHVLSVVCLFDCVFIQLRVFVVVVSITHSSFAFS